MEWDRRLEARRRRTVALCIRERVRFLPRAMWSSLRVVDETEEASVCVPVLSVLSVSGSVAQSAALLEELRSPAGPGPGSGEGRRAAWRCRWRPRDRVRPLLTETGQVPRRGRRAEESVLGAAEEPPCLGSGGLRRRIVAGCAWRRHCRGGRRWKQGTVRKARLRATRALRSCCTVTGAPKVSKRQPAGDLGDTITRLRRPAGPPVGSNITLALGTAMGFGRPAGLPAVVCVGTGRRQVHQATCGPACS